MQSRAPGSQSAPGAFLGSKDDHIDVATSGLHVEQKIRVLSQKTTNTRILQIFAMK